MGERKDKKYNKDADITAFFSQTERERERERERDRDRDRDRDRETERDRERDIINRVTFIFITDVFTYVFVTLSILQSHFIEKNFKKNDFFY